MKNSLLRTERLRRGWSQDHLADFAGVSLRTVQRAERGEALRPDSIQLLCKCLNKSPEDLGLFRGPEELDSTYQLEISYTHAEEKEQFQHLEQVRTLPQIVVASSQLDIDEAERDDMERRNFLKSLAAGATLLTALPSVTDDDLLDRFFRALKKPSTIDTSVLVYLERRTKSYWQDRHSAVLASSDLFSYVIEHFNRVVSLLETTQSPAARLQLCANASWTTLPFGRTFHRYGVLFSSKEIPQSSNHSGRGVRKFSITSCILG